VSLPRPTAPPAVRWIVGTLEDAGHPTWAVGGAVRDVLAGRPSGDWDLATRARPGEVRTLFRRTVPIGVEHGTVGVLAGDGTLYEVTTFRRDVETDGRHAVVAFAESIEEDLARRDFTINAVAWHPLREELLDPFGGAADLSAGILRTVGDPGDRFAEDYLRVLRGLRFAGRFGLEVEPATWEALRAATPRLPDLSAERIRDELLKVLEADPVPSGALELYRRSGALAVLYPELEAHSASPAWREALEMVDRLPRGRPLLRLAGLLRRLDVPARDTAALLVRLRLSNVKTDDTARWAGAPPLPDPDAPASALRGWLAIVGREHWRAVLRLELARARVQGDPGIVVALRRRLREVLRSEPPLRVAELAVDGRDLIRLGLRPGPRFGTILDALLQRVLEDPDRNQPETLRAEALRMAREAGDV
jgi:tRNA nucleotidyltransferase (CCA-adding enzyme)